MTGLTVRTLQHYDNIGVLPASGRTEAGHRFYTESDMMRLEQVVFYRRLGFSLDYIKKNFIQESMSVDADKLLTKQKHLLYQRMESMQNSIAAIEAAEEITAAGKSAPWKLLSAFMQSLDTVDLAVWGDFQFTEEQEQVFSEHLPTIEDVLEFYNTWKRLSIKAAAFLEAGIGVEEVIAQNLAAEWEWMTLRATGGKREHRQAYLQVDRQRGLWNEAERKLIERAEPYLDKIIEFYKKS